MQLQNAYPISLLCEMLGVARSSYYYAGIEKDEAQLKAVIEEVAAAWPTYGYRRITKQLQRQGYRINSKRVRRLMAEMRLLQPRKRLQKPPATTQSGHPYPRYSNLVANLTVSRPEQVWVCDISYIRLLQEFVYLAIVMDVFTRSIRGWHLGRSLEQSLTLTALNRALSDGRKPDIHHSDQGVQYAATAYVNTLSGLGIAISMAEVGQATQNPFAERVIRTIKEEEVYLSDYQNYQDAYHQIGRFIEDVYQHKRIHSALGYLTPAEFEAQWLETQTEAEVVH